MRIKIGETIYSAAALDRISLRNLIKLEGETVELGKPMRWSDLRALVDRVSDLPPDELEGDDDFPWFLGMIVWAARLEAGEEITFSQAVDFPMGDLDVLADPGDEVSEPRPRKARPASGRAAARRPSDRKAKAPKGSAKASSGA